MTTYEPSATYFLWGYDEAGEHVPLYVGVSSDPIKRLAQHRTRQPWSSMVRACSWSWHQTRDEAELLERYFIAFSEPVFNTVGRKPTPHTMASLARRAKELMIDADRSPLDFDHPDADLFRMGNTP
jgi:hypothetical protein